jgi:hypothetical protein
MFISYKILSRNLKTTISGYRREDYIKMDLQETGYDCVDWIHLPQDEV